MPGRDAGLLGGLVEEWDVFWVGGGEEGGQGGEEGEVDVFRGELCGEAGGVGVEVGLAPGESELGAGVEGDGGRQGGYGAGVPV